MARTRFKFEDLLDSGKFYLSFIENLFCAQIHYLETKNGWNSDTYYKSGLSEEEIEAKDDEFRAYCTLEKGLDDYGNLWDSVRCLNRAFVKLLDDAEILVAYPLIRLQLDNLTYIFAEMLYPCKVLHKIFKKGRTLNQIKIDGVPLNPTEIRKQIDERFNTNISKLYKKYSCFVHPSNQQKEYVYIYKYHNWEKDKDTIGKKRQKEYAKDMVKINNILTEMLKAQISSLKEKTNEISNNRKSELPTS